MDGEESELVPGWTKFPEYTIDATSGEMVVDPCPICGATLSELVFWAHRAPLQWPSLSFEQLRMVETIHTCIVAPCQHNIVRRDTWEPAIMVTKGHMPAGGFYVHITMPPQEETGEWSVWSMPGNSHGWHAVRGNLTKAAAAEYQRRLQERYPEATYVACPSAVYPWD